jgi:DNA-binding response OmpR family regulator
MYHLAQMITRTRNAQEVLIVEDDVPIQRLVAAVVARNGFSSVVAGDGRSALALLDSADYDVLVLDLGLPGLNGFDVLRHVAIERPALLNRTIVITASDEKTYRNSPHVRHARALLRKPFDVAKLQNEIRACSRARGEH